MTQNGTHTNGSKADEGIFEVYVGENTYAIQQFEIRKVGMAGGFSALTTDGTPITLLGPNRILADVLRTAAMVLSENHGSESVKAAIVVTVSPQDEEAA